MTRAKRLITAFIAMLTVTTTVGSAEALVRASCTEAGRSVYREDLAADSLEKRELIRARHPNAMCVFVDVSEASRVPVTIQTSTGTDEAHLSQALLTAAAGRGNVDDADLSAALSAILGKKPGDGYQPMLADTVQSGMPIRRSPGIPERVAPNLIGVALAVYNDVPLDIVMEHWRSMSKGTKVMSKMTPTLSSAGKVTMLAVDGLSDEDVGPLCEEAQEHGAGCLAAY